MIGCIHINIYSRYLYIHFYYFLPVYIYKGVMTYNDHYYYNYFLPTILFQSLKSLFDSFDIIKHRRIPDGRLFGSSDEILTRFVIGSSFFFYYTLCVQVRCVWSCSVKQWKKGGTRIGVTYLLTDWLTMLLSRSWEEGFKSRAFCSHTKARSSSLLEGRWQCV